MSGKKTYCGLGGVLCLLAAVFVAASLTHPTWSFPWANRVSYTLYALYGIYTALVFCMPRFQGASLAACGVVAAQFIALAFIVIFIGTRTTWFLTMGLVLTCAANFANLALQKRRKAE